MSVSKFCKEQGLKSLREVSEISNTSEQSLYNLYHENYSKFECIVLGAAFKKNHLKRCCFNCKSPVVYGECAFRKIVVKDPFDVTDCKEFRFK